MAAVQENERENNNTNINTNNTEKNKKKSQGKRKIRIEEIKNKTRRQVTFSKRRVGLFKKASEICSLCGAEAAIVTFSGAGKLFSFGHPNAHSVILRYLNNSSSSSSSLVGTHIATEKISSISDNDEPILEDLGLAELEDLKVSLESFRNRVVSRLHEINSCTDYNTIDDHYNHNHNNVGDFGGVGWNYFPQPACDFGWMDPSLYDYGMPSDQINYSYE